MSSQTASPETRTGLEGHVPSIGSIASEAIGMLALAAHAYLSEREGKADLDSAEIAIDIASAAFERAKGRLSTDERLAITQLLTETRLAFVRRREPKGEQSQ
jgi:hypothetical protein